MFVKFDVTENKNNIQVDFDKKYDYIILDFGEYSNDVDGNIKYISTKNAEYESIKLNKDHIYVNSIVNYKSGILYKNKKIKNIFGSIQISHADIDESLISYALLFYNILYIKFMFFDEDKD